MGIVEKRLEEIGIELSNPQNPVANYVPAVRTGNLLYLSGVGPPAKPDGSIPTGKVGTDLSIEEGYEAARLVGINILARLKAELGDLDRVVRVVKLLSMVNCDQDFTEQPAVANGCSDLMVDVFGEAGRHARSAVGMGSLPMGIAAEIEAIVEIRD